MSKSADIRAGGSNRSSNDSSQTVSSVASSQHSPLSTEYGVGGEGGNSRRLKSQYPRDANEKHVEYILVASFHVDRGPIMEHQYPGAISGDEHMLAELMLPDQAHVRTQDWTIFFLHKDTSGQDNGTIAEQMTEGKRRKKPQETVQEKDSDGSEDNNNGQDPDDGIEGNKRGNHEDEDVAGSDTLYDSDEEDDDDDDEEERLEGPPLVYVLNLVNTKRDPSAPRY